MYKVRSKEIIIRNCVDAVLIFFHASLGSFLESMLHIHLTGGVSPDSSLGVPTVPRIHSKPLAPIKCVYTSHRCLVSISTL